MTIEFVSTEPTVESLFFNQLIQPNTAESVLTRVTKFIDDKNLFSVEVTPGTSLNSLATEYLGDSFLWNIIADANGIDPLSPIDIGKILKVPTEESIISSVKKYIIDSPTGKQLITDVKQSILDLSGIGTEATEFSKTLQECIGKVINFKFDNTTNKKS